MRYKTFSVEISRVRNSGLVKSHDLSCDGIESLSCAVLCRALSFSPSPSYFLPFIRLLSHAVAFSDQVGMSQKGISWDAAVGLLAERYRWNDEVVDALRTDLVRNSPSLLS